jgi:hypothetical protein
MLLHSLAAQLHHDSEDEILGLVCEVALNPERTGRISERKEIGRSTRSHGDRERKDSMHKERDGVEDLVGHEMTMTSTGPIIVRKCLLKYS